MSRPMVNVYELDEGVEQLVYREMNDEEFKDHKARLQATKEAEEPEHPLLMQVKNMTKEERQQLYSLLREVIEE